MLKSPCNGSWNDSYALVPELRVIAKKEDDRIKKVTPKTQPLSKSSVKADGRLQMQGARKPQFA